MLGPSVETRENERIKKKLNDLKFISEFKKLYVPSIPLGGGWALIHQSQALITPCYCPPNEAHRNLKGKLILIDRKNYHSRKKF